MKSKSSFVKRFAGYLLALALAVLVLAAQAAKKPATIPPDELRGLHFSHKFHLESGLECKACHAAQESRSGTDDLLPRHAACTDCHDVTIAAECTKCHLSTPPKLGPRITSYNPKFDHARHISKANLECSVCHADLNSPLPREALGHLPKMADCMNCHEQKNISVQCASCHLPKDDLRPADHKLDWVGRHGASASSSQEACMVCHKTDDCQRCHNGDAITNPHPRDYVSRHGQDAHLTETSCSVCHENREFCNNCHRTMNVLPKGHFQPGWLTSRGGDHAEAAQFDLESCIACHDQPSQQPTCARCHRK